MTDHNISAFGVDHGSGDIEKAFNPIKALKGLRAAKGAASGGKHAAPSGTAIFEQVAAKHGFAAPAGSGGGKRIATTPGKRKGSYKAKSFNPFGGGGARRA